MEEKQPKVSVIIPIYNVEEYLEECLDSVVNQDLKDIELILIDDGSTDNSKTIAQKYCDKYKSCTLLCQKNSGLSATRNVGLRHSRGKYIYFLDSDDYLREGVLKYLYEEAENNQAEVVIFDAEVFVDGEVDAEFLENSENTNSFQYKRGREYGEIIDGKQMFYLMNQHRDYRSPVWMYFYEREFLLENDITFFEGIIHEDLLYTPEVLWNAQRVLHRKKELYIRRIRPGSIMTTKDIEKKIMGYYTVVRQFLDNYLEKLDDSKHEIAFFQHFYNLYCGIIILLPHLEKKKRKIWTKKFQILSKDFRKCRGISFAKTERIFRINLNLYLVLCKIYKFL